MSMTELLFSFTGRLNRKPFWLTTLAIIVVMLVLVGFIFAYVGGAAAMGGGLGALGGAVLILIVLYIPLIWIGLALGAKRLHDRNKSAWWLLVFYVLPSVLQGVGEHAGGLALILGLAGFAISIWGLVELGFLRGTIGSNQYGPDPLAGTPAH